MSTSQSMLFLSRHAPYGAGSLDGFMDILLTAAAFDQDITLVFSDDGVYHLLKDQHSEDIGLKNIAKALPALALYDVNKVLVEQSAFTSRGLKQSDLIIPVQFIESQELCELLESSEQVFNF